MSLLARGASPAVACAQLGIGLADVVLTLERLPEFATLIDRVQELLSQNVAAALYRSAMEGSVTAQQNYLKTYPPPGGKAVCEPSFNSTESGLTDEELIELLKTQATAFLAELDSGTPAESGSRA